MPSIPASETEWNLLLAACSVMPDPEKMERLRMLLRKPIRWPVLLKYADQHGVTFLLHQALSEVADRMPPEEIIKVQKRYRVNIHRTMFFARELIRILDCLDHIGVDTMPYKGVVLAESIYGDMALRQSGDIDLFIRARDFPRISDAIRELGYTSRLALSKMEERAYLHSGYECPFDGPEGPNLLELQWALQPRFYAVDIEMEDLFRRSVPVTIAGRSMRTPSPEDLLIVLSLHAAKHVWGRLIWLSDIARIMNEPKLNWEWIKQQACTLGIARILHVTLVLANRLLDAKLPDAFQTPVDQDPVVVTVADEVVAAIANGTAHDIESLSYFRLMLRLRERAADRMRFLSRLALTPGPNEWKAVRLPAALFPLYRIVRLSRLAARVARA